VQCQGPLVPLLSSGLAGVDRIVSLADEPPTCDVQAPLMSLPRLLGVTTLDAIPARVPYLAADAALVERWRQELRSISGLRVGIGWQGNPRFPGDRLRSVPLKAFAPLARLDGVRLISLQKGPGAAQLHEAAGGPLAIDVGDRLDEDSGPFMDTAAILKNLDLFVTSDSAVAHLAGALGVRTWVVLSFAADWRWLRSRDDTPWYPGMRLFRQATLGDWDPVFVRVAEALGDPGPERPVSKPIMIEVGAGELLDRLAILEIKAEKIRDPHRLRNVWVELDALCKVRKRSVESSGWLDAMAAALKEVNLKIWEIEEEIRATEKSGEFGPRFVELARSICRNNDHRASIKRAINDRTNSRVVEEKSYHLAPPR
jgi:hypothetical protein